MELISKVFRTMAGSMYSDCLSGSRSTRCGETRVGVRIAGKCLAEFLNSKVDT